MIGMSVLIKGMKMPKSCSDCLFFVDGLYDANDELCSACLVKEDNSPSGCGYGEIDGIDHTKGRMCWCPLVEVPEPHGRLIDADEICFSMMTGIDQYIAEEAIRESPTVIEAEGE